MTDMYPAGFIIDAFTHRYQEFFGIWVTVDTDMGKTFGEVYKGKEPVTTYPVRKMTEIGNNNWEGKKSSNSFGRDRQAIDRSDRC